MPFQFDIPSFLLNLRQIQQHFVVHRGFASERFVDSLDSYNAAVAMVDLLEMEIEGLPWNHALKPCEQNELKVLYMLRKSEAMAFYRNPKRSKRPKFKMIFCNPSIVFPNCLLDALCKNMEFQKQAKSMAKRIANDLVQRMHSNDTRREIPKDELELLVRSFPLILNQYSYYNSYKAIKLMRHLPFLERLRMELGFERNRERVVQLVTWGHLWDIDKTLCIECLSKKSDNDDEVHESQITSVDVMKELRSMGLFCKEDITQSLSTASLACSWNNRLKCTDCSRTRFAETRFEFLVDMEPRLLSRYDRQLGKFPLHGSIFREELCAFSTVLELGVQHFPDKLGFLFHRNGKGKTALELAYKAYAKVYVDKVVNSLLFSKVDAMETPQCMLVSLAMDERVDFEAIYTILRRDPSILARSLSRREPQQRREE